MSDSTLESVLDEDVVAALETGDAGIPISRPFPLVPWLPLLLRSSGLYSWSQRFQLPIVPLPIPRAPIPIPRPLPGPGGAENGVAGHGDEAEASIPFFPLWRREELRLDVDGRYPQMTASGTMYRGLTMRLHWIASLTKTGRNQWSGTIWFKDGDAAALPHTSVAIVTSPTFLHANQTATVTFSGGGAAAYSRTYAFQSPSFHQVQFEYDSVKNAHPVTSVGTCAHPTRPSTLPCETLTLERVYERAGFAVAKSGGDGDVPIGGAGGDALWSNAEMHDAMQTYWSRFANAPQWSLWVLFAALSDSGTSLGGIMFDDIGPNHRQGTAIFTDAFIANAPAGDANPAAWVQRMRFWTAAHEMGHSFNLAHSWQKALGTPWIPLANEGEARSFMNYPYRVAGGQAAFFADFAYRFSDQELLFLRHAPSRFVEMGNANWFDHHGFEQADVSSAPALRLEVRANRATPTFEFLEPVSLELKLTNVSARPQVVDRHDLAPDNLTVVIKKSGKTARQWAPFSRLCHGDEFVVLQPGESIYTPLRLFAGTNGWDVSEPGAYEIQVALHLEDQDIVSDKLLLRVAAPRSWKEEALAADVFTEEVGRALVFSGTQVLSSANETLEEVVSELPDSRAALHAQLALSAPLAITYKRLEIPDRVDSMSSVAAAGGSVRTRAAKADEAATGLSAALVANPSRSAETLGHITYKRQVDRLSSLLADGDDGRAAAQCQQAMLEVFEARKVVPEVLDEIAARKESYAASSKAPAAATKRARAGGRALAGSAGSKKR